MRMSAGHFLTRAGKPTAVPHHRAAAHVAAMVRVHRKLCN
jgi:hypothetical protein